MSNFETARDVGIIEENIEIIKNSWLYNDEQNVKFVNAIGHILKDYTRQKQINEEHQKINGELREKVEELEKANRILLAEKENWHKEETEQNKELVKSILKDILENDYIEKQKIKDKIEILKMEEHYDYLNNKKTIEILQELL